MKRIATQLMVVLLVIGIYSGIKYFIGFEYAVLLMLSLIMSNQLDYE